MDLETDTASPSTAPSGEPEPATPVAAPVQGVFRERFEALMPRIQKEWPEVARHTLEATRGSFDQVVEVIARQSGTTVSGVRQQLTDLLHVTTEQASHMAESLKPLEEQLESLLDELNTSLRPRIEKPVRERPLLALGIAAGVGLIAGLLLSSGRRSA
ncbi:MAG: glycine zipper domain-containing protein [Cyanobium sp.]